MWAARALILRLGAAACDGGRAPLRVSRGALVRGTSGFAALALLPRRARAAAPATCDQAVSKLVATGGAARTELYIIGTAHVSEVSAELVRDVIRTVKPDTIMLELDASRVRRAMPAASDAGDASAAGAAGTTGSAGTTGTTGTADAAAPAAEGSAQRAAVAKAAKAAKKPQKEIDDELLGDALAIDSKPLSERLLTLAAGVVGKAISNLYKGLDKRGFSSGEEFKVALDEAKALNAEVILGDRPAKQTLKRLAEALRDSGVSPASLLVPPKAAGGGGEGPPSGITTALAALDFSNNDSLKDVVETLKARENVRAVMGALKAEAPELYQALVAERDAYMANTLQRTAGRGRVVAVVGIAHADGIEENLVSSGAWKKALASC